MTASPGLGPVVKRYLAPHNSGEFWAIVAVFIAMLALTDCTGQGAGTQTIIRTIYNIRPRCLTSPMPPKIAGHPEVSDLGPWGAVVRSRC
jgi:hypothetical protein